MTSPSSPVDSIAKAMEGVTPGPWTFWVDTNEDGREYAATVLGPNINDGGYPVVADIPPRTMHGTHTANAAYIAACNPVAMREVLDLARQAEAMKVEMAEKDARIAAMEEALKPFAAHRTADGIDGPGSLLHIPDEHPLLFNGLGSDLRVTVTVGDVRRARALIGGGNAE